MNKYINYTHGETGIELSVVADLNSFGNIEIKKVFHKGEDIRAIIGDDLLVDIEMFCENCLDPTEEL